VKTKRFSGTHPQAVPVLVGEVLILCPSKYYKERTFYDNK